MPPLNSATADVVIPEDRAPEELARQWLHGIRIMHIAHGIAGKRHARLARVSGVLVTVLTAVTATTLFTSAATTQESSVRITAGVLSLVAAMLGVAQVALNYPEMAFRHRQAYVGYGALRRKVETALVSGGYGGVTRHQLEAIHDEWREVEAAAPTIGFFLRRRARAAVTAPFPRTAAAAVLN
jgi:hypothetical protein